MPDYKKMYLDLTAKVADAVDLLISAQIIAEEEFISSSDEPVLLVLPEKEPTD